MLLSAITDEISMDLGHALDVMAEYDCEAAELRSMWGSNIADLTSEQVDEARRVLDEKGMTVCCIASPLFKCELDPEAVGETGRLLKSTYRASDEQMELLKRCHRLANTFGTSMIRIFSYWRRGQLTPEIEDAIASSLVDAVKYAEDNGLLLVLENEHDCYLGTGAETARFLSRMDSPALKAVWDPGNAFFAGEVPYPDGYEAIRNYTAHVHVKDAELLASGKKRFVTVGDGEIDYAGQFAALKADGYSGYISLETHYRPFGGTQEQASRLCLQSLNKLLSD